MPGHLELLAKGKVKFLERLISMVGYHQRSGAEWLIIRDVLIMSTVLSLRTVYPLSSDEAVDH